MTNISGISNSGPAERMFYDNLNEKDKENLLNSLSEREKKFQQAAYELYVTEKDYIEDMKLVIEVFYQPLINDKILPPDVIQEIFTDKLSNLQSVHEVIEFLFFFFFLISK